MIGRTIGHYRIVARIGEGGMGVVYRARDEHLQRDVALKVLPAGLLADDRARRRFRQEALALSKLNHPNIQTVHDFDTQDEIDFLVTEYVEGVTLSARVAVGALPEKDVLHLGAQLADGLAAAHAQGIVHRDLKPANLRVTPEGRLKILDFGLAWAPSASHGATTRTAGDSHAIAGTLPYMAPEQLRGEAIDGRTDLFAAGCVLFEFSTGRRAFPDAVAPRLTDAILHSAPVPPCSINARLSAELERIILKCLEKDPDGRYQSATELALDLRRLESGRVISAVASSPAKRRRRVRTIWLSGVAVTALVTALLAVTTWRSQMQPSPDLLHAPVQSLAVLPLRLIGDPQQEYVAEGLTEALGTAFAQIRSLKVKSGTSARRYRNTDKLATEIAGELGVDALIEGTVIASGDRLLINVNLIDGRTDRRLWTASYDRQVGDVLNLFAEVTLATTAEIGAALRPSEHARLTRARSVEPAAYDAFLRGLHFRTRWQEGGCERAVPYFQQAIGSDPAFAEAYASLAWCYAAPDRLRQPAAVVGPKAREAVATAITLDGDLAMAHSVLAYIKHRSEYDWPAAEREFQRALELTPSDAEVLHAFGEYLQTAGRTEEGIAMMRRGLVLDPFNLDSNVALGFALRNAGKFDEAIVQLRNTLGLDRNWSTARFWLAEAYASKGSYNEAVAEYQTWLRQVLVSGRAVPATGELAVAYARSTWRGFWQKELELAEEEMRRPETVWSVPYNRYCGPYYMARRYARLGDHDRAIASLEGAYAQRHHLMVMLKMEPLFDGLRTDPRFQDVVRRVRIP